MVTPSPAHLTHTSGFAYTAWNADLLRYEQRVGGAIPRPPTPLVRDAGERWEYGTSIDWVGRLVEQVSGQSLEEYFRANVLDPLAMADTSFLMNADRRARLAGRYQRDPSGALHPLLDPSLHRWREDGILERRPNPG